MNLYQPATSAVQKIMDPRIREDDGDIRHAFPRAVMPALVLSFLRRQESIFFSLRALACQLRAGMIQST